MDRCSCEFVTRQNKNPPFNFMCTSICKYCGRLEMIIIKICQSIKCTDNRSKLLKKYPGYYNKAYKEVRESVKKCPDCGDDLFANKVRKVKK